MGCFSRIEWTYNVRVKCVFETEFVVRSVINDITFCNTIRESVDSIITIMECCGHTLNACKACKF